MPMLFAERVFDWRIIPHKPVSRHQQIYFLKYTSNMAVVTLNYTPFSIQHKEKNTLFYIQILFTKTCT